MFRGGQDPELEVCIETCVMPRAFPQPTLNTRSKGPFNVFFVSLTFGFCLSRLMMPIYATKSYQM